MYFCIILCLCMFCLNACLTGDTFPCPRENQFKCTGGEYNEDESEWTGSCITLDYIGDNILDCPDKSDECEY